jgi:hypothetical protein
MGISNIDLTQHIRQKGKTDMIANVSNITKVVDNHKQRAFAEEFSTSDKHSNKFCDPVFNTPCTTTQRGGRGSTLAGVPILDAMFR